MENMYSFRLDDVTDDRLRFLATLWQRRRADVIRILVNFAAQQPTLVVPNIVSPPVIPSNKVHKYVYIIAPYTHGDPVLNVRTAIQAAESLVTLGFVPFIPLLTHLWHLVSPHEYEYWMNYDFGWLIKCDAVLRLPGFSPGGDREEALAKELGIPVFDNVYDLS